MLFRSHLPHQFNTIWQEHERTGRAFTILSDQLSLRLIDLQNSLEESSLYEDVELRKHVIARAVPPTLLAQVGLETLMHRLPASYALSVFASYVASVSPPSSRFVERGLMEWGCSATSTSTDCRRRASTSTTSSRRFTSSRAWVSVRMVEGVREQGLYEREWGVLRFGKQFNSQR